VGQRVAARVELRLVAALRQLRERQSRRGEERQSQDARRSRGVRPDRQRRLSLRSQGVWGVWDAVRQGTGRLAPDSGIDWDTGLERLEDEA